MRLQKFLARAGVASRRHAEELIVAGRVMVNGQPAELGCSVDPGSDEIRVDGGAPVRLAEGDVTITVTYTAESGNEPEKTGCGCGTIGLGGGIGMGLLLLAGISLPFFFRKRKEN